MKAIIWILLPATIASYLNCTSGPSNPAATEEGSINGVVLDAFDGSPIAGATVTTTPATQIITTDASGSFVIDGVRVEQSYTVTASREGFESASISVRPSFPTPSVSVTLPLEDPSRRTPGNRGATLDVRVRLTVDEQIVTFEVQVQNTSNEPILNVMISDRLDALFATISPETIDLNTTAFPAAGFTMDEDGRSFTVHLGTVAPTAFVQAFTFSVALPGIQGVHCNHATVQGGDNGEPSQSHAACIYVGG